LAFENFDKLLKNSPPKKVTYCAKPALLSVFFLFKEIQPQMEEQPIIFVLVTYKFHKEKKKFSSANQRLLADMSPSACLA